MALSDTGSIFANDSYAPQAYATDPLSTAVGNTRLSPPGGLLQTPNTPTANTVSSPGSDASGVTSGTTSAQAAGSAAKGIIKSAVVATKFMLDLNNAKSAYRATNAQIQNNLMLSRLNEADVYSRGRQSMLDRRIAGENMANEALLKLTAQGLDVNSAGAQNVIKSYEAMGIYNSMREEANMYREAFKFDVEQSQLEYAKDIAELNYEQAKFNATTDFVFGQLDAGASMIPIFA